MGNLSNQYISSSYQSVLNMGTGSGANLTSTLQPVTDGFGTVSPLSLSTTQIGLVGGTTISGSLIPQGSGSFDLGSPSNPWRHGYFSSASIYLDNHPVLSLASNESADTVLSAAFGNNLKFSNNITFDSSTTASIGAIINYIGRGEYLQTQQYYSGSQHFINTNGNIAFSNIMGSEDTTSSGSIAFNTTNGGNIFINATSGALRMESFGDDGNTFLRWAQDDTGNYDNSKYIIIKQDQMGLYSNDGNSIQLHNNSGSIVLDAFQFDATGSFISASDIKLYGNNINFDANTFTTYGTILNVGNFHYNVIEADISGSGVQYGGWGINVSSSLDGTFAGNVLSDLNSGSLNYAPSLGYAVSSFQSETPGMVVPVYYSGDLNDAGSDVLMISTSGTTTIYRNVAISGSLHQSGTFYADAITFTNSPSIVETTGSYIMTYDVTGAVTYDTYPNVAAALQPYLSGGTGSYPTVIEASAIQSTGSISLWAEGGYVNVTGSIKTNGPIIWDTNAFNYSTVPSGALYFSTLSGGTLHFNDDGGEGDVYMLNGQGSQLHINGNTNISGSLNASGSYITLLSPDIQIQSAIDDQFHYPNYNANISGSLEYTYAGVNVADIDPSTNYGQLGFSWSSFQNTGNTLVAAFYGPGIGNNIGGVGNDNVAFYFDATSGATPMNITRDTNITGSLTVSSSIQSNGGFGQVELLTNQTLGSGSDTVITFNNDEFDPSGWYNTEYFYYQPTIAGIYQISYSVNFEPATAGTGQINVQVSKDNGMDINQLAINQHELNLLSNTTLTGTVFAQLDGDLDKVYLTAYSSVGQDVNGGNGTYLNIKLL